MDIGKTAPTAKVRDVGFAIVEGVKWSCTRPRRGGTPVHNVYKGGFQKVTETVMIRTSKYRSSKMTFNSPFLGFFTGEDSFLSSAAICLHFLGLRVSLQTITDVVSY